MDKLTDRDILKELGFDTLADLCGTENVFRAWIKRGIPWDRRGHIAHLASTKGVRIPDDFFMERRVK